MNRARDQDLQRLLGAIATANVLSAYSQPSELHPSHLPVALVHAVHDVPPRCEDEAAAYAERYAMSVVAERVREDRWTLPPPETQHTLEDLCARFESVGLDSMESILNSHSRFPGTDLSRVAYVAAAADALRSAGVSVLQDVHAVGPEHVASALASLPGDGRAVARRLLTYSAHDDWVLADEPVRMFVAMAIGVPKVSGSRAADLVREAAYELLVSPRDLDVRLWRAGVESAQRA